jgi:hypothetical protein
MRLTFFILLSLLLPPHSSAHHSFAGVYDQDQVIEVEGELTRVFWRNPHIRLWVKDGDGQTWEIEGGALRWLERGGITRDLFVEGDVIRVAGNPARRKAKLFAANNVLLPDGREALMGVGQTPLWSDRTIAARVTAKADARAAQETATGIFRVWSRDGSGQQWNVSRTAAAEATRTRWVASRDDPTLRCIAPGMVEAMTSPYPIELIEDGEDIIVRLEEWDGIRRVHMNDSAKTNNVSATPMGYSVGHWEGNTLVVSTKNISWPLLDSRGTPQSADVSMVERFAMTADQSRMTWEVVITDPINLTQPATVVQEYEWVPGVEIRPYNCALADDDPP